MIEVTQIATAIAGTASAVGAVGAAGLGVRVLLHSFKSARAAGLSVSESFEQARAQASGNHADARQIEKQGEAEFMASQDSSYYRQLEKDREAEWMRANPPKYP